MVKKILLLLVFNFLYGSQMEPEVLEKIKDKMAKVLTFDFKKGSCKGVFLVSVCHENKLFLATFVKNILSNIQIMSLKKGFFLQDKIFIKDITSRSVAAEYKKDRKKLAEIRKMPEPLRQKERDLFLYRRALKRALLQEDIGFGAKMVCVHGKSIPIGPIDHVIVLRCEAKVEDKTVLFEVDVASFCDIDEWLVMDADLPEENPSETYLLGVDSITFT